MLLAVGSGEESAAALLSSVLKHADGTQGTDPFHHFSAYGNAQFNRLCKATGLNRFPPCSIWLVKTLRGFSAPEETNFLFFVQQ